MSLIKQPYTLTTIQINQNLTDPNSMVTKIVDTGGIKDIRTNSHRYTGTLDSDGVMLLKQLDDSNSNYYADGTPASLTTLGNDVWMKLPKFWYKAVEKSTDIWYITFAYGECPDSTYKEWDDRQLFGVYEMYQGYSVSGKTSTGSLQWSKAVSYATSRGSGYNIISYEQHRIMAFLFIAYYLTTDAQKTCGHGTDSYTKVTGATDILGMTDTTIDNGNSMSINFWGLENWWGNKFEWCSGVRIDNYVWNITDCNGISREYKQTATTVGFIAKILIGENLDIIPTLISGTEDTGYCDYFTRYSSASNRKLLRCQDSAKAGSGIIYTDTYYTDSSSHATAKMGSRLSFYGNYEIL